MSISIPSLYPGAIDGYQQLPLVENGSTELTEDLPNTKIDAILKIENTLGINPQGSLSSLSERLSISINPDGTIKPIPIELLTAEPFQDRNITLTGGGKITWNASTSMLEWTENLVVHFPVSGNTPTLILPSTAFLPGPNSILAVQISRSGAPQIKSFIIGNLGTASLNSNDAVILAVRDFNDCIYWRNGIIYESEDYLTFKQTDATRINYKSQFSTIPVSVDDVQNAIDFLDNKLNNTNNTSNTLVLQNEQESIQRDDDIQAQIDDIFPDEDRSTFLMGGGQYAFNSGTGELSFTEDIRIYQPTIAGDAIIQVASSPITLSSVRGMAAITIDRVATTDYNVSPQTFIEDALPSNSTTLAFAYRINTNAVRLLNGHTIFDDASAPYKDGELPANHVKFDNSTANLPTAPDNIQAAIDDLDQRLDSVDGTITSKNFVPIGGIILMEGTACPAGFEDVTALAGLFPRFGAVGSVSPVGSNSHTHTGSSATAGSHTHSLSGLTVTPPLINGILVLEFPNPPLFTFDAFPTGTGAAGVTGTVDSAGNHSHSLTVNSSTHIPQHALLLACRSLV